MQTIPYMIGYNDDFMKFCNSGWGCGYLLIPPAHPFVENVKKRMEYDQDNDFDEYGLIYYCQFDNSKCDCEQITLATWKEINGINYLLIGFDTAHSWNSTEKDTFTVVFDMTMRLQQYIDSFSL